MAGAIDHRGVTHRATSSLTALVSMDPEGHRGDGHHSHRPLLCARHHDVTPLWGRRQEMGYTAVGTLLGLWLGAGETMAPACLSRLQHRRILAWLA